MSPILTKDSWTISTNSDLLYVLVQSFPRTVWGQGGGRLSRDRLSSLKQTSARQRRRR
jgi:hypothetical protein